MLRDGVTTFVTGAGAAGAQRESSRHPTPLVPELYEVCIDLHLISWVFPRGHRVHVAVSNSMWPMIWPTPFAMTTTLELGGEQGSRIDLPVVPEKVPCLSRSWRNPKQPKRPPPGRLQRMK